MGTYRKEDMFINELGTIRGLILTRNPTPQKFENQNFYEMLHVTSIANIM